MTPAQQFYLVLADAVLVVHFAFVAFVVLGLILIWLGRWQHWHFVNSFWFRITHLGAIAVVALESLTGMVCPLTHWEDRLRLLAGTGTRYESSFIETWLHRIMFFDFDPAVFTAAYVVFFLLVATSAWLVPVHWPDRFRHHFLRGKVSNRNSK